MGRWFVPFFVGLAVVGVGIFGVLYMNRGSHLELKGEILKVRTLADGDGTIVFADFRVTNAAAIPFVVSSVKMTMETPEDEVATAVIFSKSDVDNVTKYLKVLGPKYNDVLSIKDKLPPVQTVDRMAAGRFPFPARFLQQRKTLRLRIEEVDGAASEITEKNSDKTAAK
jgi:hypothetical protein